MDNLNELYKYIQKVASKLFLEQQFKNTLTGTIVSSELGYYEVKLTNSGNTSVIQAKALDNNSYFVDDYVYLLSAENASGDIYKTNYFIFGLVSTVEQNYYNLSDWERFSGEDVVAYADVLTTGSLEFSDKMFIDALKEHGSFAISARFTAHGQSDFGLSIKVVYSDESTEDFIFDTSYFSGQPALFNNTEQHTVFTITKRNVEKIIINSLNPKASIGKVSLQIGTLTNVVENIEVKLENVSKKSFFNKNDQSQLIEIKANVKYGNQILDTKELKYYWFVKDDSIKEEDDEFNVLAGQGWRCLNTFRFAQVLDNNSTIVNSNKKLYDASQNYIKLEQNHTKLYENKIKCIIGHKLYNAESEILTIYNFDHEECDVSIEIIEGELPLLYSDETVKIGAKMLSKIVVPDNTSVRHEWYLNEEKESLKYYDGTEYYNYFEGNLTVGFSNKESTQNIYYLPIGTQSASFYCKVFIDEMEVAESNRIAVYSTVSTEKDLQEVYNYQYFISDKNNIRFKAKESEEMEIKLELSNGTFMDKDRFVYYVLEKDGSGLNTAESLEWLKTDAPFKDCANDRYYLYYTAQKIVKDANKNNAILRYDDYFEPKILRCCDVQNKTVVSELSEVGVEQLNNFNALTNKGLSDGIYFQDAKYSLSTTFDSKKLATGRGYYKKEGTHHILLEQNSNNYVIVNGVPSAFISGKQYYEQEGGDLYINATYIRSGHLEVSNGEDKIFSANMDTKEVNIGGFHIKDNHFAGGENNGEHLVLVSPGWNSDNSSKKYAFWAGKKEEGKGDESRPFWVDTNGNIQATKLKISSSNISIGADPDQDLDMTLINLSSNINKATDTAQNAVTVAAGANSTAQSAKDTANAANSTAQSAKDTANAANNFINSTFYVSDNAIYISAGKTLYLGSGAGKGELYIDTDPLKLYKDENSNWIFTILDSWSFGEVDGKKCLFSGADYYGSIYYTESKTGTDLRIYQFHNARVQTVLAPNGITYYLSSATNASGASVSPQWLPRGFSQGVYGESPSIGGGGSGGPYY